MLDGAACASDIVEQHDVRAKLSGWPIDEDRTRAELELTQQVAVIVARRNDEQSIDPPLAEHVDELTLAMGILVRAARDDEKPALARDLLDASRDRRVDRMRDVLDDESQRARALPAAQGSGHVVPAEAETFDRVVHERRGLGPDARLLVNDAGDGLQADPRGVRHVGHRRSAPSCHDNVVKRGQASLRRGHAATCSAPVIIPTTASRLVWLVSSVVMVRPSRSTVMRSATANTSGRLWLIMITVRPWLRTSLINSSTMLDSRTPSAAVGSSMITMRCPHAIARATATACPWPPESLRTGSSTDWIPILRRRSSSSARRRMAFLSRKPNQDSGGRSSSSRPRKRFPAASRWSARARSW